MLKVYQVKCESDMTEGRGGMRYVTSFLHEQDAWDYCNNKVGIMGRRPVDGDWKSNSSGRDWDVVETTVYESLEESTKECQDKIKQEALSKLTTQEKEILGLL